MSGPDLLHACRAGTFDAAKLVCIHEPRFERGAFIVERTYYCERCRSILTTAEAVVAQSDRPRYSGGRPRPDGA